MEEWLRAQGLFLIFSIVVLCQAPSHLVTLVQVFSRRGHSITDVDFELKMKNVDMLDMIMR